LKILRKGEEHGEDEKGTDAGPLTQDRPERGAGTDEESGLPSPEQETQRQLVDVFKMKKTKEEHK
jgi:hypothetical protein